MRSQGFDAEPVRCLRCRRVLRATASVRAGYGRSCRTRIRAAALADAVKDFSQAQVDKARELTRTVTGGRSPSAWS
jgi:hypothetical protein